MTIGTAAKLTHSNFRGNFKGNGVIGGGRDQGHKTRDVCNVNEVGRFPSQQQQPNQHQSFRFQSLTSDNVGPGGGNTEYNKFVYLHQQNNQIPLDRSSALSNAWLTAIDQATFGLRTYQSPSWSVSTGDWKKSLPPAPRPTIGELEFSIAYLSHAEQLLYQNPMCLWNSTPKVAPPEYHTFEPTAPGAGTNILCQGQLDALWSPVSSTPSSSSRSKRRSKSSASTVANNRYASIASPDSDDEDDDCDLEEAGDRPLLHLGSWGASESSGQGMDIRRLIIRVCVCQSDLWNFVAMERVRAKQWALGAKSYHQSSQKTRQALGLADDEICKWWSTREAQGYHQPSPQDAQKHENLVRDADVVGVAIQQLTQQRDKYVNAAERQRDSLLRKLNPIWKSREETKRRWGDKRWRNNPNPKRGNRARAMLAQEEELQQVLEALEIMDETSSFSSTLAQLEETSQKWHLQLSELKQQAIFSAQESSFFYSPPDQGNDPFLSPSMLMSQTTDSTVSSTTSSARSSPTDLSM